jgi:hypothetical protein
MKNPSETVYLRPQLVKELHNPAHPLVSHQVIDHRNIYPLHFTFLRGTKDRYLERKLLIFITHEHAMYVSYPI